jgi:hypothetical protein
LGSLFFVGMTPRGAGYGTIRQIAPTSAAKRLPQAHSW